MELKKCVRCGAFFASTGDVCSTCADKDKKDIYNLNNCIGNSPVNYSIDDLSADTGVSIKNINRFIANNSISNL